MLPSKSWQKVFLIGLGIWLSYEIYSYLFPKKVIQAIIPRSIKAFKEKLEQKYALSQNNVLFKYPRVELIAFNFVQPFINKRGYIEHFEISMNAEKTILACMFKFGTDMQGYLQYVHYGALLALLEEVKNILMEHYWKTEDKVKDNSSVIEHLRPLKIHKIYFLVGKLKQVSDDDMKMNNGLVYGEIGPGEHTRALMKTKIMDEKEVVYFKSRCICTKSPLKELPTSQSQNNLIQEQINGENGNN